MARRLGNETVTLWTKGMEQYGRPRAEVKLAEFKGCWVGPSETSEGVATQENVSSSTLSFWIPAEVELKDSDDYFVWARRPDEKYDVVGLVDRYYDRRGNLRACEIAAELRV